MNATTPAEQYKELNASFEILGNPHPKVEGDWPCLEFDFCFKRKGKEICFTYKMGIGCFPINKLPNNYNFNGISASAIEAMKKGKRLFDKNKEAQIALLAWKMDKSSGPKGEEVLCCLCIDAIGVAQTSFEEWAAEFGYDSDSRKAESIYRACQDIYFKLIKMFSWNEIQEIAQWEF